jgi:hypothetical protein
MARTSPNMMIERADEYRTLANQRRARGMHHGASAKGWDYKPGDVPDDYRARAQIAREQLRLDILTAWNDYQSACFNIRHGEDDLIDFAIPF